MLACLVLVGCSENFGIPPVPPGTLVLPTSEGSVGPVFARSGVSLAGGPDVFFVGTNSGLFRADVSSAEAVWTPAHPGKITDNGEPAFFSIDGLDVDASGSVVVFESSLGAADDEVYLSLNRGDSFDNVRIPNLILRDVDRVGALSPSDAHPDGSCVVVQFPEVHVWDTVAADWRESMLPWVPEQIGPVSSSREHVVVAAFRDSLWRFLISADGGVTFVESTISTDQTLLDAAIGPSGQVVYATASGVVVGGTTHAGTFIAIDVRHLAGAFRFAGLTPGSNSLVQGIVGGVAGAALELTFPVADEGLVATAGGGAAMSRVDGMLAICGSTCGEREFRGRDLLWTALAADPREPGFVYLGRRDNRVRYGDAQGEMIDLGTPRFPSLLQSILPDVNTAQGVFVGSYGVHYRPDHALGGVWEERVAGQDSYLQILGPGSPVQPIAMERDPGGDVIWMGTSEGDGVYRTNNEALLWERMNDGFGPPGVGEDGLATVPRVTAFAFDRSEVFIGSLRGGVWTLDSSDNSWSQMNTGLPDAMGVPVDSCCFDVADTNVDVRDLVALDDGTLLAATAWGVFRRGRSASAWSFSGDGITSSDLFALAPHPTDSDLIVAGGRGTPMNPAWLFLSDDGGQSWLPVGSSLLARFASDIVWSNPDRSELVVLLQGSGAWRLDLDP